MELYGHFYLGGQEQSRRIREEIRQITAGIEKVQWRGGTGAGFRNNPAIRFLVCTKACPRRAIDGGLIFRSRGRTERLQGWDKTGSSCSYDSDQALLDTLIALAIEPQWAWTLRANGMLPLRKAQDLQFERWLQHAAGRLRAAAQMARGTNNSEALYHCREPLDSIETGIWKSCRQCLNRGSNQQET